jgi:hypothetical protein
MNFFGFGGFFWFWDQVNFYFGGKNEICCFWKSSNLCFRGPNEVFCFKKLSEFFRLWEKNEISQHTPKFYTTNYTQNLPKNPHVNSQQEKTLIDSSKCKLKTINSVLIWKIFAEKSASIFSSTLIVKLLTFLHANQDQKFLLEKFNYNPEVTLFF